MILTATANGPEETASFAGALAKLCRAGDCLLLEGDLGAGKTTFARGFIHALCPGAGEVTSPTFTLAQLYTTADGAPLWHFDLYRLERESELEALGLDEALAHGIALIEWPQIAGSRLPPSSLTVQLAQGNAKDERIITLSGDPSWKNRLKESPW